jgi:hypothetical protein
MPRLVAKKLYVPEVLRARLPSNVSPDLIEHLVYHEDLEADQIVIRDSRTDKTVAHIPRGKLVDTAFDSWTYVLKQLAYKCEPNAAQTLRMALDGVDA